MSHTHTYTCTCPFLSPTELSFERMQEDQTTCPKIVSTRHSFWITFPTCPPWHTRPWKERCCWTTYRRDMPMGRTNRWTMDRGTLAGHDGPLEYRRIRRACHQCWRPCRGTLFRILAKPGWLLPNLKQRRTRGKENDGICVCINTHIHIQRERERQLVKVFF